LYHKAAAGNGSIHNLDVPILLFGELFRNAESKSKVFSVGMGVVGAVKSFENMGFLFL
jgi:hypothetical protein